MRPTTARSLPRERTAFLALFQIVSEGMSWSEVRHSREDDYDGDAAESPVQREICASTRRSKGPTDFGRNPAREGGDHELEFPR
jgi:hypothetical protein